MPHPSTSFFRGIQAGMCLLLGNKILVWTGDKYLSIYLFGIFHCDIIWGSRGKMTNCRPTPHAKRTKGSFLSFFLAFSICLSLCFRRLEVKKVYQVWYACIWNFSFSFSSRWWEPRGRIDNPSLWKTRVPFQLRAPADVSLLSFSPSTHAFSAVHQRNNFTSYGALLKSFQITID